MLENIFHAFSDFGLFFVFLYETGKGIFKALSSPVIFVFNFLYQFLNKLFTGSIDYQSKIELSADVQEVLGLIPYWATIQIMIGAIFLVLIVVAIFRVLSH